MVNRKKISLVGGLVAAMTISAHGLSITPTTLPLWTENEKSKFAAGKQSAFLPADGVVVSPAKDRPNHHATKKGKGHFGNRPSGHEHSGKGWRYAGHGTSGNGTIGNNGTSGNGTIGNIGTSGNGTIGNIGTSGNGVSVPDAGGTLALLGLAIGSLALVRRKRSV